MPGEKQSPEGEKDISSAFIVQWTISNTGVWMWKGRGMEEKKSSSASEISVATNKQIPSFSPKNSQPANMRVTCCPAEKFRIFPPSTHRLPLWYIFLPFF